MQSVQTQQNYTQGIDSTTVNPMQLSADAEDRYMAGIQDAVQSGRRRQKLMSTPVSVWKDNAKTKGAQRLTNGAQAAQAKVQAHFQKFGPVYEQIRDHVKTMPKGGVANALARVQYAITAMKQAAGKSVN